VTDSPVQRHSVVVAGLLVTLWTFLITFGISVSLVFTTWILAGDRTASISESFLVAVWGFLAMQGVPIIINSTTLSLPFLGFLMLTLISLYRSSRWAIRSALHEEMKQPTLISLLVVSVASISYCILIAGFRFFVAPENIDWFSVMIKPAVMVVLMSILAVGTVGGTWSLIFDDLDEMVKKIIKLTFRFTLLAITISFLLIVVGVALNYENMLLIQSSLLGGTVAVIAVIISGIGWVPNFVLWAWAWLINASVSLGVGSSISLDSVKISQLPAWPWFGLVPTVLPSWTKFLVIIPIAIGTLMAIAARNTKLTNWVVTALFLSLGVAAFLSFLSYLSSGSLGGFLLLDFGVSYQEVFQKSLTWFLIGETIFITTITIWRKARERNQIDSEELQESE
jgi:hypothetical protein